MSGTAIPRFWTLVCLAYVFLEEQNALLRRDWQHHVTLGETRRVVPQRHWGHLLDWLHDQFSLGVKLEELQLLLVA